MKRILTILALLSVLFGALPKTAAVTIYTQDWGTGTGFVGGNGTLNAVGWTGIAVSQTAAPYMGIYAAVGANDPVNGIALPQNSVYFTVLLPNQTLPGMFYTTDGAGPGSNGDTSFTQFNPDLYTNLTFSVEVRDDGGNPTNYFAVQVGGQWYVSTNRLVDSGLFPYPQFSRAAMRYYTNAAAWQLLTINATDVTIGGTPGADLAGNITGVGIVELPTTGGFDYNQIVIDQGTTPPQKATITAPGINQFQYEGGGVSIVTSAAGTPFLQYRWMTNFPTDLNGLSTGGRYVSAQTNILTITNINSSDALVSYVLMVTNFTGGATNVARNITVNPRPSFMLYSEILPYVGPSGNLGLAGVGWAQAVTGTSRGIFQNGPGLGIFFDFSTPACTNAYFTTVTNDTGISGLPFPTITPESYPALTLQARFAPGNGAGTTPGAARVYWMVQMGGGSWYSSVAAIPTSLVQNAYDTNYFAFTRVATNWNNLTINGNLVTVGSPPGGDLTGNITGAGLVFIHTASGASMNFQDFQITTNVVVIPPPIIGANYPIDRTAFSGGGAAFGVFASGQQPFSYGWTINGVPASNGGRIFGAHAQTLTIANVGAADNNAQIIAYVTNVSGFDHSDVFVGLPTALTVVNGAVGLIYAEDFPFVGPVTGNYQVGTAGWAEAVQNTPSTLFRRGTVGTITQGDGAIFAFFGSPSTTVYYTSTATDTNQSGLPFPNVKLSGYSDLTFAVDIAPNSATSTNVTAYLAVQLNGGQWYASATPVLANAPQSAAYTTYTIPFSPTAASWKLLTVTPNVGGSIGATASSDLSGVLTGAGLVFVTVNNGGTFNFDNFQITGTGLGSINVGSASGGSAGLSWVGNPVVGLQSTTNLSNPIWVDVPSTTGLYSYPMPVNLPQRYFRLIQH